jgi:hypothetical protein
LQKARPIFYVLFLFYNNKNKKGAKGIKIRTIAKAREKKLRPRAKDSKKNKLLAQAKPIFYSYFMIIKIRRAE